MTEESSGVYAELREFGTTRIQQQIIKYLQKKQIYFFLSDVLHESYNNSNGTYFVRCESIFFYSKNLVSKQQASHAHIWLNGCKITVNMYLFSGVILIIIAILTIIYAYFKYSYNYWASRGIACDEPSIPFGNIRALGTTINPGDFIKHLYNKYKPTGAKFFGMYFLTNPVAVILDLSLVKSILIKDFTNFDERGL